jgi:serine/threonine-protein kinase
VDSGHEVALKILTRTLARNATMLQRFLREARSAEALVHPNIVTIYDRGIDLGRHYIVLEYVSGGDFHDYVRASGPMSAAAARTVVQDVASGLRYAASQGLVHRDIKPSNILRTPTGQIKIIDLGLALHSDFEDERVTREGTTVGTVDYMAPEQARDSRAASVQSDIYSLGCTFYYLLTGIPPYPGGDITDKLTRHARAAVPNVTDLRPDVSPQLAKTIERMMAKQPDDRFASYDDLMTALDQAPVDEGDQSTSYALAPADLHTSHDLPELPNLDGQSENPGALSVDKSGGSISVVPVENPGVQLAPESEPSLAVSRSSSQSSPPIPRMSRLAANDPPVSPDDEAEQQPAADRSVSSPIWVITCLALGIAGILVFMGWIQYMDSTAGVGGAGMADSGIATDLENVVEPTIRSGEHSREANQSPSPVTPSPRTKTQAHIDTRRPSATWEEPVDSAGDLTPHSAFLSDLDKGSEQLPDWARSPVPDRVDGPFVVVRRIVDAADSQSVPELHMALDRHLGGTVELADEGPLYEDDFRIAGETRLVRARPGCRSIWWIEGGHIEAVRQQPAAIVLDRKTLILDGIDLIVNARELDLSQTALFSCSGANLTLKNCTITILNGGQGAFAFARVERSANRSTHIRLERTLVRGWFSSGIEIADASSDVVIDKSMILGGRGPIFRISGRDIATEQRFYFADAVLAGIGPIIDRASVPAAAPPRPMVIRSYGSAFGRLHGQGIASVVCSSDPAAAAEKQVEWNGGHNLFAGWMGFFAHGTDPPTITIANLAAVRSTWNAAETASQQIPHPWRPPSDLSLATPSDFAFLPNRDRVMTEVARPRSGLLPKTAFVYELPSVPEPASKAIARNRAPNTPAVQFKLVMPELAEVPRSPFSKGSNPAAPAPPADREVVELTFDTASSPWNGDLGAFLRDRLLDVTRHARVRVIGSGNHRCSAVRLPRGIQAVICVEAASNDPPSWSPDPMATGPGLIELQGGALVLLNLVLHHDPASRLEHLIHVEGGHLVLSQCQLTTPVSSPHLTGDLIAFRSITTQPMAYDFKHPVFSTFVDRPVCLLDESLLITNGTALKADLGRGLIALRQTAVAAGETAIDLSPSRVARWRFDSDLALENSTLTSERTIIRMGPWPGATPGPDRPWLITSQNCAFIASYDRPTRETVLFRADPSALAHGSVFWQAFNDAADVDIFTALSDAPVQSGRSRDVVSQWVSFWGRNHMRQVAGPRGAKSSPSVQLRGKLHPGRVEPADLILDPGRQRLTIGADLARQGIVAKSLPARRRRN